MGESKLSEENSKKAFDLRGRVSEREKFYIASHYYGYVGQLDKSVEEYLIWEQSYPRDWIPRNNLCSTYAVMGWYEKALPECQKALELEANDPLPYTSLAGVYMGLNRFDDAQAILEDAKKMGDRNHSEGLDDALFHGTMYTLAALKGDEQAKKVHLDWARGKPDEMYLLLVQAEEAAFAGKLKLARALWHQSADIAERNKFSEISALAATLEAHWLAEMGFPQEAKKVALAALAKNRGYYVEELAADVLASTSSFAQAEQLTAGLQKNFPDDNLLKSVWAPTVRARAQLVRKQADEAVATLQPALIYELGMMWQTVPFRTIYLRGQAYLHMGDGQNAAKEFQKIIDHRGVEPLSPYYALAHLGVARASSTKGESRKKYKEFFSLWKDADPDIVILRQAKLEYER